MSSKFLFFKKKVNTLFNPKASPIDDRCHTKKTVWATDPKEEYLYVYQQKGQITEVKQPPKGGAGNCLCKKDRKFKLSRELAISHAKKALVWKQWVDQFELPDEATGSGERGPSNPLWRSEEAHPRRLPDLPCRHHPSADLARWHSPFQRSAGLAGRDPGRLRWGCRVTVSASDFPARGFGEERGEGEEEKGQVGRGADV